MNPVTPAPTVESEIVLRRLIDPLKNFSDLVLFVPVIFAFVVLFFIMFYRQEESMSGLLKRIFIPKFLVTIGTILWSIYLLAYLVTCGVVFWMGAYVDAEIFENMVPLLLGGLVPLIAYPALLGFLGTIILCFRHPLNLIGVVIVTMLSVVYLVPAFLFKPIAGWWAILIPVEIVALIYVAMMYREDARTIHPLWAAFLALLRLSVYAILGLVFLLPGRQMYNTHETHSKVLVLVDVSDSMKRVDNPAASAKDYKEKSRQGQIINFQTKKYALGDKNLTFIEHVLLKSPVTAYRFGAVLDDYKVKQLVKKFKWDKEKWQDWLYPDRAKLEIPTELNGKKLDEEKRKELGLKLHALYDNLTTGTNVSGSALQAAIRESGHLIQAIIIFSDGQSNLGSSDGFRELHARAANPNRPIHIITVGVGKYQPPVSIRIDEIRAPQQARPDDDFKVQVPVYGDGLPDRPFEIFLDITRVKKKGDKWETDPGFKKTIAKKGKFKGGGEHPYDTVDFDINVRKLWGVDAKDKSQDEKLEGYWEFNARVPRVPGENTAEKVHTSKRPGRVLIQKRKLRVLLFAGGPSREYQFVRTIFYREVQEKRAELTIFLQTGLADQVDQDVAKERLLTSFPTRLGKSSKIGESLQDFDVVIAFDPDWGMLDKTQLDLLKKWVGDAATAGGFILVAGPINSYQLARPGGRDISSLQAILPVKLKDSRLHNAGIGHDSSRPYVLHFSDNAAQYGFLNLTDNEKNPFEGWKDFFWEGETPPAGKDVVPFNGIYNYYPVEKVRPASKVLATFAGPPGSRINDGREEMPYIVSMKYGAGKSVFVGSGELWRLRQWDENFHQRFWVKLARFAGSGNLTKLDKYGMILMARRASTGSVPLEALVLGEDMRPLPHDARPVVEVVRPEGFDEQRDKETPKSFKLEAKAQQQEHQGWFSGKFKVFTPGTYTLKIKIPGTTEELAHDITIYRPDPETDNPRPDLAHLYFLATAAKPLLKRLDDTKRQQLVKILQPPALNDKESNKEQVADDKEQMRLYFPLENASIIPDLLMDVPPKKVSTKGAFQDLWDQGWGGDSISAYYPLTIIPAAVGVLLTLILLFGRQWITAVIVFGVSMLFVGSVLAIDAIGQPEWWQLPLRTSAYNVLLIVPTAIGLLVIAILLTLKRWIFALVVFGLTLAVMLGVFMTNLIFQPDWAILPLQMAHVMAIVVGLLALEWLTRKLLRLA